MVSDTAPGIDRRSVLGALATSLGSVAGCVSVSSDSEGVVSLLAAGSLAVAFEEHVGPAFEGGTPYGYRGEFHGSNVVVRMVLDRQAHPDVVVSADASLLRDRLEPAVASWDVVFASNAVVVVYDPDTEVGSSLESGAAWYDALRETDADVARSDPDLDPLGYRTLQMFDLAERYYDEPGLARALEENLIVDPSETHLLAGVETGERAAAVAYRNMAADHDLPHVDLPRKLDFSDPALADHYASVSYTTEAGTTVYGTPVRYGVTVPDDAQNAGGGRSFVSFVLNRPDLLRANGLVVPETFPLTHGDVPGGVVP